jgi:hypothetical protein
VVVVILDAESSLDFLADVCCRKGMPPVIAVASGGFGGKSLEHVLLLAELRGVTLALPGPIDAIELAMSALQLVKPKGMTEVERELERRLAW